MPRVRHIVPPAGTGLQRVAIMVRVIPEILPTGQTLGHATVQRIPERLRSIQESPLQFNDVWAGTTQNGPHSRFSSPSPPVSAGSKVSRNTRPPLSRTT